MQHCDKRHWTKGRLSEPIGRANSWLTQRVFGCANITVFRVMQGLQLQWQCSYINGGGLWSYAARSERWVWGVWVVKQIFCTGLWPGVTHSSVSSHTTLWLFWRRLWSVLLARMCACTHKHKQQRRVIAERRWSCQGCWCSGCLVD